MKIVSNSRICTRSHRRCSVKKDVLRNFAKFTGKHLCQSHFLNKVAGLETLLRKRLCRRCFPVNFAKFLRTPFLQSTSRRLLLDMLVDKNFSRAHYFSHTFYNFFFFFIFKLFCGASEGFIKAFKPFIKTFEVPQRSVKIKI